MLDLKKALGLLALACCSLSYAQESTDYQPATSGGYYLLNFKSKVNSGSETYIQQNHHLPNIPSAEEVEEEVMSLGEMNAKLLEKVEELTLHQIEWSKLIQHQQEQLDILKIKNQ